MTQETVGWTIEEFAARHGISRASMYNELKRGDLKAIRIGGRRRITPQCEEQWLKIKHRKAGVTVH